MGKKNKKIKKNCPHCGKRNKFAKSSWQGAEKTKCKYCGKILANIKQPNVKEYELPVTKTSFIPTKPKEKESFSEATRPSLSPYKVKSKKKVWILFSIVIIFMASSAFVLDNKDKNTLEEVLDELNNSDLIPPTTQELCSKIQSVPSWAKDGEIIDKGYKPEWSVTYLVKNKIYFLYSATCHVCHKQILDFGDEWALYIANGYVKECW